MTTPISGSRPLPTLTAEMREDRTAEVERRSLLRKGAKGPEVQDLQSRLDKAGFPSNDPPGEFGEDTERAVKAFQASMNGTEANGGKAMVVNGTVADATWGLLFGLNGENMLTPDDTVVDRNKDKFDPKAKGPTDGDLTAAARPTNAQIYENVFFALANQSTTDKFTPSDAKKVCDDLMAGRIPSVPPEVLSDLGMQALDARRDSKPRSDYAYAGAEMTNEEFDSLMENLIGDALIATPEAGALLLNRTTAPGDVDVLNRAFELTS